MAKSLGLGNPVIKKATSIDAVLGVDGDYGSVELLMLDELVPFEGHPFCLYQGERMEDLVESIKANGVIMPIIVRPKGKQANGKRSYEIISGHNRTNASMVAGKEDIPAIVISDLPDDKALAYVIETNLMQRSFAEMTHTEKAAVLALHHSNMFSQGKRNDIITELNAIAGVMTESETEGEKPDETPGEGGQTVHDTRALLGDKYDMSARTVARYLRLQYLVHALKTLLDAGEINLGIAVELSFLKEEEQVVVADLMEMERLKVDKSKVRALRDLSEEGELDELEVYKVLSGAVGGSVIRTPSVRIDPDRFSRYFSPSLKKKDIEEIVEEALDMFFAANPDAGKGDDNDPELGDINDYI